MLTSSDDWLLVAPDGRLDGSNAALARFVAWRVGERVARDEASTRQRRVLRLWQRGSSTPSRWSAFDRSPT